MQSILLYKIKRAILCLSFTFLLRDAMALDDCRLGLEKSMNMCTWPASDDSVLPILFRFYSIPTMEVDLLPTEDYSIPRDKPGCSEGIVRTEQNLNSDNKTIQTSPTTLQLRGCPASTGFTIRVVGVGLINNYNNCTSETCNGTVITVGGHPCIHNTNFKSSYMEPSYRAISNWENYFFDVGLEQHIKVLTCTVSPIAVQGGETAIIKAARKDGKFVDPNHKDYTKLTLQFNPPKIQYVQPSSGTIVGGTLLTIVGKNFGTTNSAKPLIKIGNKDCLPTETPTLVMKNDIDPLDTYYFNFTTSGTTTKATCSPNPCKNGGTCVLAALNPSSSPVAQCTCSVSFTGPNCEIETCIQRQSVISSFTCLTPPLNGSEPIKQDVTITVTTDDTQRVIKSPAASIQFEYQSFIVDAISIPTRKSFDPSSYTYTHFRCDGEKPLVESRCQGCSSDQCHGECLKIQNMDTNLCSFANGGYWAKMGDWYKPACVNGIFTLLGYTEAGCGTPNAKSQTFPGCWHMPSYINSNDQNFNLYFKHGYDQDYKCNTKNELFPLGKPWDYKVRELDSAGSQLLVFGENMCDGAEWNMLPLAVDPNSAEYVNFSAGNNERSYWTSKNYEVGASGNISENDFEGIFTGGFLTEPCWSDGGTSTSPDGNKCSPCPSTETSDICKNEYLGGKIPKKDITFVFIQNGLHVSIYSSIFAHDKVVHGNLHKSVFNGDENAFWYVDVPEWKLKGRMIKTTIGNYYIRWHKYLDSPQYYHVSATGNPPVGMYNNVNFTVSGGPGSGGSLHIKVSEGDFGVNITGYFDKTGAKLYKSSDILIVNQDKLNNIQFLMSNLDFGLELSEASNTPIRRPIFWSRQSMAFLYSQNAKRKGCIFIGAQMQKAFHVDDNKVEDRARLCGEICSIMNDCRGFRVYKKNESDIFDSWYCCPLQHWIPDGGIKPYPYTSNAQETATSEYELFERRCRNNKPNSKPQDTLKGGGGYTTQISLISNFSGEKDETFTNSAFSPYCAPSGSGFEPENMCKIPETLVSCTRFPGCIWDPVSKKCSVATSETSCTQAETPGIWKTRWKCSSPTFIRAGLLSCNSPPVTGDQTIVVTIAPPGSGAITSPALSWSISNQCKIRYSKPAPEVKSSDCAIFPASKIEIVPSKTFAVQLLREEYLNLYGAKDFDQYLCPADKVISNHDCETFPLAAVKFTGIESKCKNHSTETDCKTDTTCTWYGDVCDDGDAFSVHVKGIPVFTDAFNLWSITATIYPPFSFEVAITFDGLNGTKHLTVHKPLDEGSLVNNPGSSTINFLRSTVFKTLTETGKVGIRMFNSQRTIIGLLSSLTQAGVSIAQYQSSSTIDLQFILPISNSLSIEKGAIIFIDGLSTMWSSKAKYKYRNPVVKSCKVTGSDADEAELKCRLEGLAGMGCRGVYGKYPLSEIVTMDSPVITTDREVISWEKIWSRYGDHKAILKLDVKPPAGSGYVALKKSSELSLCFAQPQISMVTPNIAGPGQVITIKGKNFGIGESSYDNLRKINIALQMGQGSASISVKCEGLENPDNGEDDLYYIPDSCSYAEYSTKSECIEKGTCSSDVKDDKNGITSKTNCDIIKGKWTKNTWTAGTGKTSERSLACRLERSDTQYMKGSLTITTLIIDGFPASNAAGVAGSNTFSKFNQKGSDGYIDPCDGNTKCNVEYVLPTILLERNEPENLSTADPLDLDSDNALSRGCGLSRFEAGAEGAVTAFSANNYANACDTIGSEGITLMMAYFDFDSLENVLIGGVPCTKWKKILTEDDAKEYGGKTNPLLQFNYAKDNGFLLVYCEVPEGAGSNQQVSAIVAGITFVSKKLILSFKPPVVQQILPAGTITSETTGSACKVGVTENGNRNASVDCDRSGSGYVCVMGSSFGPSSATVLIGPELCQSVRHVSKDSSPIANDSTDHSRKMLALATRECTTLGTSAYGELNLAHKVLVCQLPQLVGKDLAVRVIQKNQFSTPKRLVSYEDCPAGTHSNSVERKCQICDAGKYASFPGMSECIICEIGKSSIAGSDKCVSWTQDVEVHWRIYSENDHPSNYNKVSFTEFDIESQKPILVSSGIKFAVVAFLMYKGSPRLPQAINNGSNYDIQCTLKHEASEDDIDKEISVFGTLDILTTWLNEKNISDDSKALVGDIGYHSFDVGILAMPGSSVHIEFDCTSDSKIKPKKTFIVETRSCTPGEVRPRSSRMCLACDKGKYADRESCNQTCCECPVGALCEKNISWDKMYAAPEHWVAEKSNVFYACDNEACLGGKAEFMEKPKRGSGVSRNLSTFNENFKKQYDRKSEKGARRRQLFGEKFPLYEKEKKTPLGIEEKATHVEKKKEIPYTNTENTQTKEVMSVSRSRCAEGYEGPLCGVCESGFQASGRRCLKCWSPYFLWIANVIVIALSIVFVSFLAIHRFKIGRRGDKAIISKATLRIMINFVQTTGALGQFKARGPALLKGLWQTFSAVNETMDSGSFPLSCLMNMGYVQSTYLSISLPFMAICVPILALRILMRVAKFSRGVESDRYQWFLQHWKTMAFTCMIISLFLVYMRVTRAMLSAFDFVFVQMGPPDTPEVILLRSDLSQEAFSTEHVILMIISGIGLIFFSLGTPVYCYILLRKRRLTLSTTKMKVRLGFLYDGLCLERGFYWWELVSIIRKVLVVMIATLVHEPFTQLYLAMWVLLINMFVHVSYQPYTLVILNRIESLALLTMFMTQMGSILYWHAHEYDVAITASLLGMNLVAMCIMISVWAKDFFYNEHSTLHRVIKWTHKHSSRLCHRFSILFLHPDPDGSLEKKIKQKRITEGKAIDGSYNQVSLELQMLQAQIAHQDLNDEELIAMSEAVKRVQSISVAAQARVLQRMRHLSSSAQTRLNSKQKSTKNGNDIDDRDIFSFPTMQIGNNTPNSSSSPSEVAVAIGIEDETRRVSKTTVQPLDRGESFD